MTIPRTIDDVTAAWCAEALGRPVAAVKATQIAAGVGLVGQLHRLELAVDDDGPTTMIAKLAAPTDEGRFVATVLNMYGREVGFYDELSAQAPVRAPACYFCAHDPATQDTVLLLEDVSGLGRNLDQIAGCSAAQARPLIRALAALHAAFWDERGLDGLEWVLKLSDEPYPGAVSFAYDAAWPAAQELFADQVTPRVKEFGDAYRAQIPALFARLCDGPRVLAHADWRVDNLFVTPDDDVIAVDWQLVDRSVGPRDLAYLVTQSVNVTDDSEYEVLFTAYVDDLAAAGVDLERAWAWDMYRFGAMLGFVYPVIAAGALTVEDPRHIEVTGAMLRRSIRALDALDAFSLQP
jgi:hypothetical protein